MKGSILLVEDDRLISSVLVKKFTMKGYSVNPIYQGESAKRSLLRYTPDYVILDLHLRKTSGFEVFKNLRPIFNGPIFFLTANSSTANEIIGLKMGAADFIDKASSFNLIYHRFKKGISNEYMNNNKVIIAAPLTINEDQMLCSYNNRTVPLTSIDLKLLNFFYQKQGQLLTRDELYISIYNLSYNYNNRSIDVNISRLKNKFNKYFGIDNIIISVRGKGYKFNTEAFQLPNYLIPKHENKFTTLQRHARL